MRALRYKMLAVFVFVFIGIISLSVQTSSAVMLGCTNGEGDLFRIDTATGASTLIGALPSDMTECVYDAINNRLYAQASDGSFTLYRINPSTGASMGSVSTDAAFNGMAFVDGTLYATAIPDANDPSTLVTVDPATGVSTPIGLTGFGPIPGLAYNAATGTLYGVTNTSPANLITLNITTGAGTVVGSTGLNKIGSIRFGENGVLYGGLTDSATTRAEYLVRINTSTGVATPIGNTGFSITGLALIPAPATVPTMSEWGMILFVMLAGTGAAYHLRRQKKAGR